MHTDTVGLPKYLKWGNRESTTMMCASERTSTKCKQNDQIIWSCHTQPDSFKAYTDT